MDKKYIRKEIMSNCEQDFYKIFNQYFGKDYTIQPQISLNSIIQKTSNEKYANELNRTIDFGFFDKKDRKLLLLIEINDMSHNKPERKERDAKVKNILNEAGIKLITFWTNKENKTKYIVNTIGTALGKNSLSNLIRRIRY